MLPYPGFENEEQHIQWETTLLNEVCSTLKEIYQYAGAPKNVYVAVDGVVPMAKLRQQRMRRFKSLWWAEKEIEMGVRVRGAPRWDTNAITPGTRFMDSLTLKIGSLCTQHNWKFSSSNEPGEGEHKLMRWLRNQNFQNVCIFGLDADLIFLAMSAHTDKSELFLLRELQHLKKMETKLTEDNKRLSKK
jgi:5'-3' exonuclease